MKVLKQENGFSLLEVLIALVILAIGLLALVQMQVAAMHGNVSGNEMTGATSLASNTIERLMGLPYNEAKLISYTTTIPVAPDTTGGITDDIEYYEGGANNENYTRVYWVQNDTPRTGMKQITVRVRWADANNKIRSVTMATQKAQ